MIDDDDMTDDQGSLDLGAEIPDDALDHLDDPTVRSAWEGRLQEICEVVEHALSQRQETRDVASELAFHVVFQLADTLGGSVMYLPRGERLRRAIRDACIYRDWHERGMLPEELHRRYKVAVQTIYAIINRQRAIRRRAAPDLFGFDDNNTQRKGS